MEGEQGQSLVHLLQETKAHKREVLEAEWYHQVVNGETVEGSKGLKHTCQSSPKLRKIQQQAGSIVKKWRS